MPSLVRFGVSLPADLMKRFDALIKERNYTARSKAIGDLIRQELIKKQWEDDTETAGAITLIFDHHKRDLLNNVTDIQHDFQNLIISTQHVHLDHNNCLEIIAVRGIAGRIRRLADALKALKGVKHATLSMSSTGKDVD
jgi:CopG family nickel-responsive transcriptional regulator